MQWQKGKSATGPQEDSTIPAPNPNSTIAMDLPPNLKIWPRLIHRQDVIKPSASATCAGSLLLPMPPVSVPAQNLLLSSLSLQVHAAIAANNAPLVAPPQAASCVRCFQNSHRAEQTQILRQGSTPTPRTDERSSSNRVAGASLPECEANRHLLQLFTYFIAQKKYL